MERMSRFVALRSFTLTRAMTTATVLSLAAPAMLASSAQAQGLSERIKAVGEQRAEDLRQDVGRGQLLGALLYSDITVNFERTQAKTAFEYVQQQLGVPLIVRYAGEGGADGIDPEMEISLAMEGAAALSVVERMLEMCGTDSPCTWQIREGFIEAGTKDRLSVPAARELRMYPVRDLLFEPPNFDNAPDFNLSAALEQGNQGGQGGGSGGGGSGGGGGGVIGDPGEDPDRPSETEKADQLMEIIQDQCEPEAWQDAGGDAASIRYYQGVLIIRAPDFIHRQIDGYPFAPVRPRKTASSAGGSRRYVTFTAGLSVVQNLEFRSVPVNGAVGGSGNGGSTGSPIVNTPTVPPTVPPTDPNAPTNPTTRPTDDEKSNAKKSSATSTSKSTTSKSTSPPLFK